MGFYRDDLLGAEFTGNAFTCEPVNQLVHRMVLKPNGTTFTADRPADEAETEFLTSTDNWFRPVEARTAPDGSLWIVDMYRYVIEHSRWIPQNVQDELDVYAGNNLGRIYRVLPKDAKPRPWPRLDKLEHRRNSSPRSIPPTAGNATWLSNCSSRATMMRPPSHLHELAKIAKRPATRLQALCTLGAVRQTARTN